MISSEPTRTMATVWIWVLILSAHPTAKACSKLLQSSPTTFHAWDNWVKRAHVKTLPLQLSSLPPLSVKGGSSSPPSHHLLLHISPPLENMVPIPHKHERCALSFGLNSFGIVEENISYDLFSPLKRYEIYDISMKTCQLKK